MGTNELIAVVSGVIAFICLLGVIAYAIRTLSKKDR